MNATVGAIASLKICLISQDLSVSGELAAAKFDKNTVACNTVVTEIRSMRATLLEVTHLTKRYGAVIALEDVALDVIEGEVLGLVGPNGAGKTTLFECLAGVQPRDAGQITATSPHTTLFYMPDGITPWESQRVAWTLRFFAALHNRSDATSRRLAVELGLAELAGRRIKELSRGQRKRFLIALALMTPHSVVLLDEPFEGLDLRQTRHVSEVLRRAAAEGRTLFLSIHQLTDAARVCDRMVLLSSGRVVAQGTIDEMRAHADMPGATLEELFLALT
jgi:ABC-type multidrug transport system ATPase subunit